MQGDRQGWKDRYTVKEYREQKGELNKLAAQLPAPVYVSKTITVAGFRLIAAGVTHYGNYPVIGWQDYSVFEHELLNQEKMIRGIFLKRGMPGLLNYIVKDLPVYMGTHRQMFPDLYRENSTE